MMMMMIEQMAAISTGVRPGFVICRVLYVVGTEFVCIHETFRGLAMG
jgi:hypothetical protein